MMMIDDDNALYEMCWCVCHCGCVQWARARCTASYETAKEPESSFHFMHASYRSQASSTLHYCTRPLYTRTQTRVVP